jgi:hypothetical protein
MSCSRNEFSRIAGVENLLRLQRAFPFSGLAGNSDIPHQLAIHHKAGLSAFASAHHAEPQQFRRHGVAKQMRIAL